MFASNDIITKKTKIARHPDLVGGKAQNLAKLTLAGFPVPEFFVISTRCFSRRLALKKSKFIAQLTAALNILSQPEWASPECAVRSSSTIEDQKGRSFAGLFASHLHKKNVHDIFAAIESIWESAAKEHVGHYANRLLVKANSAMAVIVQRMIRATVSGVLFTRHPVANYHDSMLLEVIRGECEKLVSGQQTPTQIILDKRTRTFSCGAAKNPDQDEILVFLHDNENFFKLLQLGIDIENLFGCPQDIEWLFDGQKFWVLQSRPVTTLTASHATIIVDAAGTLWSDYFFAERFVQPVSPLAWSFLQPIIRRAALQTPLWYLGHDHLAANVQLKLFRGFPRTQLENFQKLFRHIPPSLLSVDKKETLHLAPNSWQPPALFNYIALFSRLLLRELSWFPPYNLWKWQQWQKTIRIKTDNALFDIRNSENFNDCYKFFGQSQTWSLQFLNIHRWSITFADIFLALLKKLLQKLKLEKEVSVENLTGGLADNATIQANKSLLALNPSNQTCLKRFQKKFGHRSESLDIASPTWGEGIAAMAEVSRKAQAGGERFLESLRQAERLRQECRIKVKQHLKTYSFPISVVLLLTFRLLLHLAQQFTLLRENQRDMWHKILQVARYSSLRMAQHGIDTRKLAQIEDIFYLHVHELAWLQQAGESMSLRSLIEKRKRMFKRLLDYVDKPMAAEKAVMESGNTLGGIGVSKGRFVGRARVAATFAQAMRARAGEILVVPCADPGWSPIFAVIGGLVMERGGILSHASIVAREFQLPTITCVYDATKRIADGDLVEMDGENGRLKILEHAKRRMSETNA